MLNPMKLKFQFRSSLMSGVLPLIATLTVFGALFAQAQQATSPTPIPKVNSDNPALRSSGKSSGMATPEGPLVNPQELELLTKAADKVLNRIQSEENDLYLRVSYFEKPDRLNPNSYASKEEVAQWQEMLKGMKAKHDLVAQLYANLGKDLDVELKQTGANEQL